VTAAPGLVVDAHHHLWPDPADHSWLEGPGLAPIRRPFTPVDLVAELAAHGVHRTVLVEGGREHPDSVPPLLALAAATEQVAGVVAWADLADPRLAATLAGYRDLPGGGALVGVRSQVQHDPDPDALDRPEQRRGLAAVAAAGLVFDLVVRAEQLPAAARAAADLPELSLVLDHLGKPRIAAGAEGLAAWRGPVEELARSGNVTCKVSGMVTEAHWSGWDVDDLRPFVEVVLAAFGPRRLMFGSDWPVCLLASTYGGVLDASRAALPALPDTDLAEIFAGTAIRTYGLRVSSDEWKG
jgi:L-fuconolactonase